MTVKRTIVMAAAALTLAVGLGTEGALTANAATRSCGPECIDIFSQAFPDFYFHTAPGPVVRTGQPVNLARGNNTNQGEDFAVSDEGTVHDFFLAGLVGAALNARYGNLEAFQFQFTPFGAPTGLCVGVPSTPFYGTSVELEPCGVSSKTLWILVSVTTSTGTAFEFINGAETFLFGQPFVLSAFSPGSDLLTWPLGTSFYFTAPNPNDQLWGVQFGVLP